MLYISDVYHLERDSNFSELLKVSYHTANFWGSVFNCVCVCVYQRIRSKQLIRVLYHWVSYLAYMHFNIYEDLYNYLNSQDTKSSITHGILVVVCCTHTTLLLWFTPGNLWSVLFLYLYLWQITYFVSISYQFISLSTMPLKLVNFFILYFFERKEKGKIDIQRLWSDMTALLLLPTLGLPHCCLLYSHVLWLESVVTHGK